MCIYIYIHVIYMHVIYMQYIYTIYAIYKQYINIYEIYIHIYIYIYVYYICIYIYVYIYIYNIYIKRHCFTFQQKSMIKHLQLCCWIKEMPLSLNLNRMTYLNRNVPSKIFYASIVSEILRIVRTTADVINLLLIQSKKVRR